MQWQLRRFSGADSQAGEAGQAPNVMTYPLPRITYSAPFPSFGTVEAIHQSTMTSTIRMNDMNTIAGGSVWSGNPGTSTNFLSASCSFLQAPKAANPPSISNSSANRSRHSNTSSDECNPKSDASWVIGGSANTSNRWSLLQDAMPTAAYLARSTFRGSSSGSDDESSSEDES
jgi:hypothetical protein